MIFDYWDILLVDDEPDVLSVTKLALRDVKVYDLPIRIHTAASKAEAIEKIKQLALEGMPETTLAVALIDVVMESDHAGLELCDYIRNTLKNWSAQLYIRTGQPGIAPERTVIDKYDISGYFTKVETTEAKLYTLVKSGVRQWFSIYYARLIAGLTNQMLENSVTKKQFMEAMAHSGGESLENPQNLVSGLVFEKDFVFSYQSHDQVRALHDELDRLPPRFTTPEGHKLVVDGRRLLVKIAPTDHTVEYYYAAEGTMVMPEALLDITYRNGLALSILWKRAA